MSTYRDYTEPLEAAIGEMRRLMALPENIRKSSWRQIEPEQLAEDAQIHLNRMRAAILEGRHGVARLEAANVANYAWMAADSAAVDD